ncbi:hypothetical protein LBMAG42_44610 [Deltaproteobacteria bacterium]|nr:hypothetical protein LBMAG42_44610 [Deltaproteobacteria bacterium]
MSGTDDEKHDHTHEHDESCAHEDEEGDDIVTLVDADGGEVDHYWLGLVELDEEQFALLCPVDEVDEDSETTNVYVYHYSEDEDGAESFEAVEDEELLARVQAAAEKMFDEAESEEEA